MADDLLTIGIAASRIGHGVQVHHLRRLADLGEISCVKAGRLRLVSASQLGAIREACARRGYYVPESREVITRA